MNVYQSIEWVREARGNFNINRNTARHFGSREMNKNLSMAKNLVNSKWLPLGSKSINLSIYANKKLQHWPSPHFSLPMLTPGVWTIYQNSLLLGFDLQ